MWWHDEVWSAERFRKAEVVWEGHWFVQVWQRPSKDRQWGELRVCCRTCRCLGCSSGTKLKEPGLVPPLRFMQWRRIIICM